jgi:hypothetical protein
MKISEKIILVILIGVVCSNCRTSSNENVSIDKEKDRIEKVMHSSIGWAGKKDLALLHSVIANDSAYLEVDPENRIVSCSRYILALCPG